MKKEILSENSAALLNKKITDVAKSNPSEDMWFIKAPGWEGFYLEDEERDGNFSYWHLYDKDDEHKGTVSIENGVITQLPRNLSESKTIKKKLLSEETKRMKHLAGIINEETENVLGHELDYTEERYYLCRLELTSQYGGMTIDKASLVRLGKITDIGMKILNPEDQDIILKLDNDGAFESVDLIELY
jgi:hypothetical protein